MSEINKIKSRLGRNSIDRHTYGDGVRTRGESRRGKSLRADHKRSLAKQFGYPDVISLAQHYNMANRNGIGYNLCYGIVSDCWRIPPVIYDGEEDAERRKDNPTEFEKAIDEHFERLSVWQFMEDLDYSQRPMRYGALMMLVSGSDSGSTVADELKRLPSMEYLLGMRVYNEAQLPVEVANQNPASLNYGDPLTYNIRTNVAGSTNEWEDSGFICHASRVFAYGEGAIGKSIYGVPALEASFEALMDEMKIRGASAEGLYQNSSNKYAVHFNGEATAADADAIDEEMEDFDNEISRSMMLQGGTLSMLQTTLTDPLNQWNIAVNAACSPQSKPMKMVIGNQTGERASSEDITTWNRVVMDRQSRDCGRMIEGFIDYLTNHFTLPAPTNKLNIVWRDLNESTTEQQVDLAKKRAETNKLCVDSRMQPIYTTEFMQGEAGAPVEEVVLLDVAGEESTPQNEE